MAYNVTNLKSELSGVLHGTTVNQITNINDLINRSARKLLNDIDPQETIRTQQLSGALYDEVYDYVIPNDLKDDRIVDIRPQENRNLSTDRFFQTYSEEFDLYKTRQLRRGEFSIKWNSGVKSIRITKNLVQGILLNGCDTISGDGS